MKISHPEKMSGRVRSSFFIKKYLLTLAMVFALLPFDQIVLVRSEERSINFGSSVSTFDATSPTVIARLTNMNFYQTAFTD